MILLQAKLLAVLEEQRVAAVSEIRGDMVKAEWGQQIRNYVFHPYKMVKVASWWLATLASQVDTATKGRYRSSDTIVCRVGHTGLAHWRGDVGHRVRHGWQAQRVCRGYVASSHLTRRSGETSSLRQSAGICKCTGATCRVNAQSTSIHLNTRCALQ
jgi:hypothetical protein